MALVLVSGRAFAEEEAVSNVLSVDALGLTRRELQLEGERVLSERIGVRLGVSLSFSDVRIGREDPILSDNGAVIARSELNIQGFGAAVEPGLRVYLTGRAPEGLWIGPQLGVGVSRSTTESRSERTQQSSTRDSRVVTLSGAALVGYSVILPKGITLQVAAGVGTSQLSISEWPVHGSSTGEPVPNVPPGRSYRWETQPLTRLALGWAF
ncbi:MAG TPA: hypothetical protein VLQ93_10775 [Myxococcaceae bacterium]|nr:hypothetical protein [Myxococcaceae bacterium]